MKIVYEDDTVYILESSTAQSKAFLHHAGAGRQRAGDVREAAV